MSSTAEDLLDRALPDLDEAAVRKEFLEAVGQDGRPLARIAPETGIAYQTLAAWRQGSYAGNTARVAHAVQAWLNGREARARAKAALPNNEPQFVMTRTASRIWEILEFCQATPTIGVVIGNAGVGKTQALRGYQKQYPQTTWIATMMPCHASIYASLCEIARSLGLFRDGRASALTMRILERLQGTRGMLMIDEAQHLPVEALDQVRGLFDAAGIGIVLAGNRQLDANMGLERRRDQLAQIASRVGIRFRRDRALKADIETMLDAWAVQGEAERAELQGIALQPGGLRGLTMAMRIAFGLAAAKQELLAVEHIRAAWSQLSGAGA